MREEKKGNIETQEHRREGAAEQRGSTGATLATQEVANDAARRHRAVLNPHSAISMGLRAIVPFHQGLGPRAVVIVTSTKMEISGSSNSAITKSESCGEG